MGRIAQLGMLLVALPFFVGCESFETEELGIELPALPARIALQGYLGENDTAVVVRVTASEPGHFFQWHRISEPRGNYGQRPRILPLLDAEVWLHDETDGRRGRLTFSTEWPSVYVLRYDEFGLIPGHTYRLIARHKDYEEVSAVTTMPARQAMRFGVRRQPGEAGVHLEIHTESDPLRYFVVAGYYQRLRPEEFISVTSADAEGGVLRLHAFAAAVLPLVRFDLYEVDADFYNYLQSHRKQEYGKGRNSILSPPTLVHTNVRNGYGVLGCMMRQARVVVER